MKRFPGGNILPRFLSHFLGPKKINKIQRKSCQNTKGPVFKEVAYGLGNVSQVVECLAKMHEALVSSLNITKMRHHYNSSPHEVRARRS